MKHLFIKIITKNRLHVLEVFKVFKTLLSLNSDYLINKIESTNKIKNNKEYIIGSIDKNGNITIILN